jgi:hypothetical protein
MKNNRFFLLGMLAAALTFGMLFTGCDTGTNGGGTTFSLTAAVGDGSSGMGTVAITSGSLTGNAPGVSVTVTATAAAGYHFVRWSNNTAGYGLVSSSNPYTFSINVDTTLCAVFVPDDDNTNSNLIYDPVGTWVVEGVTATTVAYDDEEEIYTWTSSYNGYDVNGTLTLEGNYGSFYMNNGDFIGMYVFTSTTTMTYMAVPPYSGSDTEVYYYGTKQE